MYRIGISGHFDAAHYIKDYPGKCSRMHGHRWKVEVVVEGQELGEMNILIDFGWIKTWLGSILNKLDHYVLNEQLNEQNVTAEFLSRWIYGIANTWESYSGWPKGARVVHITVWESPDCYAEYSE